MFKATFEVTDIQPTMTQSEFAKSIMIAILQRHPNVTVEITNSENLPPETWHSEN